MTTRFSPAGSLIPTRARHRENTPRGFRLLVSWNQALAQNDSNPPVKHDGVILL